MKNLDLSSKPTIITDRQLEIWESEHEEPVMFPLVDNGLPDPGVARFREWLTHATNHYQNGLEICCGKGRNTIWLAQDGAQMHGFDFSEVAITTAQQRLKELNLEERVEFRLGDATRHWDHYCDGQFDFIIDSFGTSDIATKDGRDNIRKEAARVLRSGGYYMLQIDSPDFGYFKELYENHRGQDPGTLVFPDNGKVETILTKDELAQWDDDYGIKLVEVRKYEERNVEIFGEKRIYHYYWIVAQKPE